MISQFIDQRAINNNRLDWIDYAKGIAISMVVYRHTLIGLHLAGLSISDNLWLTTQIGLTFRMPLFFLLSGIFFSKSVNKRSKYGYFIHKFKTIMYPYFLWSFIQMSIQMILIDYTNAQFNSWTDYLLIFYKPIGQFWFLYALFNVSILYLLTEILIKNKYILLILGIVLFYFSPGGNWGINPINDVMRLFVFFVIGDISSPYLLNNKYHKFFESRILLIALFVFAIFGEWIIIGLNDAGSLILLFFAVIGSASTMNISFVISSFHNKYLSIIRIFGYHSLYIYLLHPFVSAGFRIVMINVFGISNLPFLLIVGTILGITGPVIFYSLCNYYNLWFLFKPDRPVSLRKI